MDKEYFKNKYRTSTIRMNHWDYSWPGLYSITICTYNRICILGEIKDGNVYLSEVGKIVFDEWLETPILRPNVFLDDWIIMPNHIHGIIGIKEVGKNVETHCNASLPANTFGPQRNNLASIIRGFKGSVKRQCDKNNFNFQWQSNYYEHVIRDYEDLGRIREYIAHNPINWENDRNNPINIK